MPHVYDPMKSRNDLLKQGVELASKFCILNKLKMPLIKTVPQGEWRFAACAYYRPTYIAICVEKCAPLGKAGRSWSWPGNTVDRTPYGVIQHELGHHVDHNMSTNKGSYFGDFSKKLRLGTGEESLTGYAPNDAEWFAEIFRLFVTNPDLLQQLRPKTWSHLASHFTPAITVPWTEVLIEAPERTVVSCENKIKQLTRKRIRALEKEAGL